MANAVDTTLAGANPNTSDELFEGDPRPLPYPFEKELINNTNKHIRLHEKFVPVTKVYALASKFYARHEENNYAESERFLRYTKVSQSERRTPLGLPLLESQVYGWLPLHLKASDVGRLNFIHAPKHACGMTAHGELLIAERITERPSFNGLRFLLH